MKTFHLLVRAAVLLLSVSLALSAGAAIPADWTAPLTPFHIAGNLYYVGSRDLAAYLLTTPRGNILINANLESSPPQIRRSVEHLGFKWADTKILLSSQAHYDHAAGAAAILRETHAKQMVMDGDVSPMQSGGATDYDRTLDRYPPAHVDRVLHDGDTVQLGGTTLTAHKTAGHTPGCTTWTVDEPPGTMDQPLSGRLLHVVIVGGWAWNSAVRLVSTPGRPESYPGIGQDFEHTFMFMSTLPCDIFLGAHGLYFNMLPKLERAKTEGVQAWIDPAGYHRALDEKAAAFHAEVAKERAAQ